MRGKVGKASEEPGDDEEDGEVLVAVDQSRSPHASREESTVFDHCRITSV